MSNNSKQLKAWHERHFWLIASIIIVIAALSRFWDLDNKPFHHDESLHAYYSHAIAMGGHRDYDPLLHGPLLYYIVGLWQFLSRSINADLSNFVARTPAAFFGVILVALPISIRKLAGSLTVLAMMFFLLISPTTLYFSRFLREDIFTSVWVLGALFGFALSKIMPDDQQAKLHINKNTSITFPFTPKTAAAIFCTAMIALHFTNKENSFLHMTIWGLALASITLTEKLFFSQKNDSFKPEKFLNGEPTRRIVWCVVVFTIIFVMLFSSFFRHTQGWWNGVIDGLYRKSLLYWWQQDQQRRIDGPFDYHLPIIANYEFILIPFLFTSWNRLVTISKQLAAKKYTFSSWALKTRYFLVYSIPLLLLAAILILPRIPLVAESCSFVDVPCTNPLPPACHGTGQSIFCLLHISHSRHLLQILLYLVSGSIAFIAAIHSKRRHDAFLWFWLTGAIGAYSYVGEKVPWLTLYIVLPIILLASLEVSRIFAKSPLPIDGIFPSKDNKFSRTAVIITLGWLTIATSFAIFKSWRVAGIDAANPEERLVFTQTTPEIQTIVNRWHTATSATNRQKLHIGIEGEATWPIAWYALHFSNHEFLNVSASTRPEIVQEIHRRKPFHALFLNDSNAEDIPRYLPTCKVFRIPLRSWWVPNPNSTLEQNLSYFFKRELFPQSSPRQTESSPLGSSNVLYVECPHPDSPLNQLPPLTVGKPLSLTR